MTAARRWAVEAGDHICGLYSHPEERDAMLVPYLYAGLSTGEKCICIIEAEDRPDVLAGIDRSGDVDVRGSLESGQLELFSAAESYLRRDPFSAEAMVGFWTDVLDAALDGEGYGRVHTAGDTVAISNVVANDFDEFAVYEAGLSRFVGAHAQSVLCLYDVRLIAGGVLLELLRTHPKLLLGGLVVQNPHYLTPDEQLVSRLHAWHRLTDIERSIARLAVEGLSTAEMAARQSMSRSDVDR